ncbi:MAG: C69 family dipeptidase [Candidatus Hodarchaeota archaeon]
MCDTFIALGSATNDGGVVFGKNSDRPYFERQPIVYFPKKNYFEDTNVRCTYISLPQAKTTYSVLLSKPSWMWGAEMGANERNVVIGNEAVWTKEPEGNPALLGMDLVRLALERSSTANQALNLICDLLESYGQGGACAENDPSFTYHNSFLIADPTEAWILETAGKWWIGQQIKDGFRNISNSLSIRSEYDIAREGIVDYAIDQGYCNSSEEFDFAKCFSYEIYQERSRHSREGFGNYLLQSNYGEINPIIMMEILRDHSTGICMHGNFRTTASQVSYLSEKNAIHWLTGSPHPCISLFKPFIVPSQEDPVNIDLWDKREQYNFVITKDVIQKLHSLEQELVQTIQHWLRTDRLSTNEIQDLNKKALDLELSLIST